jgi:uncharacterized membrane protein
MMAIMAVSKSDPVPDPFRCEDALFEALITPHRSLTPAVFRALMTLLCVASAGAGGLFVMLGAWPVAGFFGLDLLALYVAFRINFRDARAFETVIVTRIELMLRKVSPAGTAREWRFNPAWTRLQRETDPDFGVVSLSLVSHRQSVVIGQALSPNERATFADALGGALAEARRR